MPDPSPPSIPPIRTTRHPLASSDFAVFVVGVAALVSWLLGFLLNPSFYGFFYISVMLATWYGGLRAGVFSIVLSVLILDVILLPTRWGLAPDATTLARLGLFAVVSALVCSLTFERGRAREGERRLHLRFEVTLDSIGDAVIATDPRGRVAYMNGVATALTGWHRDEAAGRPLEEVFRIIDEQTRAPIPDAVAKVLRDGSTVRLAEQTVLVARDSREIPIDDSGAPIRDARGRVLGVVLVFRDVTGRRKAEEELRNSRERLELVLASSGVGLWYCDLPFESNAMFWNDRCREQFGVDPEATVTIGTFFDRLHPALSETASCACLSLSGGSRPRPDGTGSAGGRTSNAAAPRCRSSCRTGRGAR